MKGHDSLKTVPFTIVPKAWSIGANVPHLALCTVRLGFEIEFAPF